MRHQHESSGRTLLEATDRPVKALFVYLCNPLATMPDQNRVRKGLEREDLATIVFDQVMTDTARYADVVLPATTSMENRFARAYGPMSLQAVAAGHRRGRGLPVRTSTCSRAGAAARPGAEADPVRRLNDDAGAERHARGGRGRPSRQRPRGSAGRNARAPPRRVAGDADRTIIWFPRRWSGSASRVDPYQPIRRPQRIRRR